MDEKALRIKITLDEIKSQESNLKNLEKEIQEYNQKITENKVRASFIEESIKRYKSDLEALGGSYAPEKQAPVSGQISKEITLQLLKDNDKPNGLMAKHLVDLYKKIGIETHGRIIFRHLEDLIENKYAYQTNPEAQRGKKYRFISDDVREVL